MDMGLKILLNGGYGVFGSKYFRYSHRGVAELITFFGRRTLHKMKEIAKECNFLTIGGDTDSLFVIARKGIPDNEKEHNKQLFIEKCRERLDVEVEHQATFCKFLNVLKKHYVGIDKNPKSKRSVVIKSMEAIKSDRPAFFNRVFIELVEDFKNDTNPFSNLQKALNMLTPNGGIDDLDLLIHKKVGQDPNTYKDQNNFMCVLAKRQNVGKGDLVSFYYVEPSKNKNNEWFSTTPDNLDYDKYKQSLIDLVKTPIALWKDLHEKAVETILFELPTLHPFHHSSGKVESDSSNEK